MCLILGGHGDDSIRVSVSNMCAREVFFFEACHLIGLRQLEADAFAILFVGIGLRIPHQSGLRRISLLGQVLALLGWKVEGLERLALIDVPIDELLVLLLVLVGHAHLARHLGVAEKLLGHWRVVHVAFLVDGG